MKKITLLSMLFVAITASAQNFYNFSVLQENYVDVQNPTSINNGEVWDWDTFSEVTIPFDFSIGGQAVDRFLFDDDYFVLLAPGADYFNDVEGVYYVYSTGLYIQDRTYSTLVSTSPISYVVEGEAGNRILKLEIKNAGAELAQEVGFAENHFYVNYQLWLYESDQSVELRYGSHNVTDIDLLTDGDGTLIGFGDDTTISLVYGEAAAPSYGEFTEATFPEGNSSLSAHPASGTVYRFMPSSIAGVPGVTAAKAALYPNPAADRVYIKSEGEISSYAVYDVTGKLMLQNNTAVSDGTGIHVEGLHRVFTL